MNKIEFCEKNLERVNYWLQFAEAKNAALIAFLTALLALIMANKKHHSVYLFYIDCGLCCLSMAIAIISFFPRNAVKTSRASKGVIREINILYWKDIASIEEDEYIARLSEVTKDSKTKHEDKLLINQFAEETIINSRIAEYKYKMFSYAVFVAVVSIVLFAVMIIVR